MIPAMHTMIIQTVCVHIEESNNQILLKLCRKISNDITGILIKKKKV